MTRKEQIQQEADIRFPDNPVAQARFKDGAEWADANPSEQWIKKARKWFKEQNEWYDMNGIRHYDTSDFKDFLKTMKL